MQNMKQKNPDVYHQIIKELGIKISNSTPQNESAQLKLILHQILCYPSVELAQKHHRANNIGSNDLLKAQADAQQKIRSKDPSNKLQSCQCCGFLLNNQQIPYSTNLSLLNLGVGVHLFFKNYSFHVILFLLMFLIYSLFSFITNIMVYNYRNGTDSLCILKSRSNGGCGLSLIGAGNKLLYQNDWINNLSKIQSWIGVGFMGLWGLLYMVKTHAQQKFTLNMDKKRVSASDFTLLLTHVPKQFLMNPSSNQADGRKNIDAQEFAQKKIDQSMLLANEQLTTKFHNLFKKYQKQIGTALQYDVVKVNVASPLYHREKQHEQHIERFQKQIYDKLSVFRKLVRQRQGKSRFQTPFAKRNQYIEQYYKFYIEATERQLVLRPIGIAQSNVVFVTLRSSQAREEIQKNNEPPGFKNFWNLCRDNLRLPIRGIKVRKAPHPEEIKWSCIGFPLFYKRLRRFFMLLSTLILIGISLGISIGIAFINKQSINVGVSIGISIVVTIVNIGIQMIIVRTSYFENQYIASRQQSSIALKIGFAQLINSIGVPIIVTVISQLHISTQMQQKSWLKDGGLVDDVFFIAIINVLVPVANYLDPWQLYLRFWRWWYSRPVKRLEIRGQSNLNKHFGNYEFDIGLQYAYLIKTSIFTSFFAPMQPIIALFAPIGLVIYYFSTKRNLFYHFQRRSFHFNTINNAVDFILLFSLPAFGFGSLLINNFISSKQFPEEYKEIGNGTLISNWIIVAIAVAFLILVPLRIFYCCIKKPRQAPMDYREKQMVLNSDFDRSNPITKSQAVASFNAYLSKLQKENKLSGQGIEIRQSILRQIEHQKFKEQAVLYSSKVSRVSRGVEDENFNENKLGNKDRVFEPLYNYNKEYYQNIIRQSRDNLAPHTEAPLGQYPDL